MFSFANFPPNSLVYRTKRTWKPNVQRKEYYSDILERTVRVKLTTAAMRWIDKAGGFDPYIYHTPDHKLASNLGSQLKEEMKRRIEESNGTVKTPLRATRTQKRPFWWNEEYDKRARELRTMKLDFLPRSRDTLPPPPIECRSV